MTNTNTNQPMVLLDENGKLIIRTVGEEMQRFFEAIKEQRDNLMVFVNSLGVLTPAPHEPDGEKVELGLLNMRHIASVRMNNPTREYSVYFKEVTGEVVLYSNVTERAFILALPDIVNLAEGRGVSDINMAVVNPTERDIQYMEQPSEEDEDDFT